MSPWRAKKGIVLGSGYLEDLVEHHIRTLAVFRTIVDDPAVYNKETNQFDPLFLSFAEFRYFLYLKVLLENKKISNAFVPPWDVALILYSHLLYPTKFCDDLQQGLWGLPPVDSSTLLEVLRRFTFPLFQLAALSTNTAHSQWTDNFSSFEWEQKYPRIPYQPWDKAREGRIIRLAQSRSIVAISVRCPNCGSSLRCGPSEWKGFRSGERQIPCRRSNCQPVKYSELRPQFRSPWESTDELAESISRAMSGVDVFLLAPGLQAKHAAKSGAVRYERFMELLKTTRGPTTLKILAPTADIDICWRTHRVVPAHYRKWCMEHVGRQVEDNETGSHQIFEGGCEELTLTENLWTSAYKEQYRQIRRSFLERMFGVQGKSAKRISKTKGKLPKIDIPSFSYDLAAYSTAGLTNEVPVRDSSINGLAMKDQQRLPRRYTSDGTLLPMDTTRTRGSFVTSIETPGRPALSNKKRSSRHSKRVSVLPAIKSIDSMMGDSDGSGEQDAKQTAEVESETGLHRTKTPVTFSEANLDLSTKSLVASAPSSESNKLSQTISMDQVSDTSSTTQNSNQPNIILRNNTHKRSLSLGTTTLDSECEHTAGKRPSYLGRPESIRAPPISMHQRYIRSSSLSGRLGGAGRPVSADGPCTGSNGRYGPLMPFPNGYRQPISSEGKEIHTDLKSARTGHPSPRAFRSNSLNGPAVSPALGMRPPAGSGAKEGKITRPINYSRPSSSRRTSFDSSCTDSSHVSYVANNVGGNVGWIPQQKQNEYIGAGRSFSLGPFSNQRTFHYISNKAIDGFPSPAEEYFRSGGSEIYSQRFNNSERKPRRLRSGSLGSYIPNGGNVELGGSGKWNEENIKAIVPLADETKGRKSIGSEQASYVGSRYVGKQRDIFYPSPY